MKFNEDGDETRKLKQRITELEEEVEILSKNQSEKLILNSQLEKQKDKESIVLELK